MTSHYLRCLLEPSSVAVVGASERPGAVGGIVIRNLLDSRYSGALYAVNPRHRRVWDVPSYPDAGALPQPPELVVIATRAATVPDVIDQCGRAGAKSAVVISAGFAEAGPGGAALERELLDNARRHRMRLVGPNCLGIMRPHIGLDATFAHGGAREGSLGLISQSGAICTALLDWARPHGIGFSTVVSLGASADVDLGEILDFLVYDARTAQILLYIEGVRDARRFMSALRAAARVKPVIVTKAGRHPTGVRAALSHTGARTGADDVFEAAVRRTGAVRVTTIAQLISAAQALASHVHPQGNRLAIVTNGGGPGVLAADRASDLDVVLAELAPESIGRLHAALPRGWSQGNPVDLLGDADAARYEAAVGACLADPNVDGVLAILAPQAMAEPTASAHAVAQWAQRTTKPLLAAWMGEERVAEGRAVLRSAQIPTFRTPEPAVEMFAHVSSFYGNQRLLMQTPGPLGPRAAPDLATARRAIAAALAEGRGELTPAECRTLLEAFHIAAAEPHIVPARPDAREIRVGVAHDRVFGPAITLGPGSVAAGAMSGRSVGLPPLNSFLARTMIEGTAAAKVLGAVREAPAAHVASLEALLMRVSEIVCEMPALREMDLHPVLIDEHGALVLGARVEVQRRPPAARPYDHMAIHPYPLHLMHTWSTPDGRSVLVRPIRPEDAELEREFVQALKPETKYLRFLSTLKELTPTMLARFTQLDYDREMALVAVVSSDGREREIGVCRYVVNPDAKSCEFAIVVAEDWQHRGLGKHLMQRLIGIARERGLALMEGEILTANSGMLDLARKLGFTVSDVPETPIVKHASLALG